MASPMRVIKLHMDGKLGKYVTPCYLSTHLCVQLSHVAIPN